MKVTVIGAGVIGLACAYELVHHGHEVVVVDAGKLGASASHGNAAKVAVAEAAPVPAPGMVVQGLKWMLRPDSPLYIKPTLSPPALRFLFRMARACNEAQFRRGLSVNLELASRCVDIFDEWTAQGLAFEMHERGTLLAFERETSFLHRRRYDTLYQRFGAVSEALDADGVHRVEPALSERIEFGLFYPHDRQIEPDSLTASLAAHSRRLGVVIYENSPVTGFDRGASGIAAVRTTGGVLAADKVVLAAGVWSGRLSAMLGVALPIRPGKGYSVDYVEPSLKLRTSLTFDEAHVAVTPLNGMIRLAGTMEFGGFEETLNERRISAIKRAAVHGFAQWDPEAPHRIPWAGLRSMTPDGLPLIGVLPSTGNVIVAAGHGMLGLTMAPVTGRIVRELVSEGASQLTAGVRPDRFLHSRGAGTPGVKIRNSVR